MIYFPNAALENTGDFQRGDLRRVEFGKDVLSLLNAALVISLW